MFKLPSARIEWNRPIAKQRPDMIGRAATCTVWMLTMAALYFFENNTGTRILLACSLFVPFFLKAFSTPAAGKKPLSTEKKRTLPPAAETFPEETEPGEIREYIPGDPVRSIHWKLSAKSDRLMVRPQAPAEDMPPRALLAPAPEADVGETTAGPGRRPWIGASGALLALCLAAFLLIPGCRSSMAALCNRLFAWSESVNTYVYDRFPVPDGQPLLPAILLVGIAAGAWIALLIISGSRLLALLTAILAAGFQVYFGVAFPFWINGVLFAGLGLLLFSGPLRAKKVLGCAAALLSVSLLVFLIWPGVDARTEAASERIRDLFSQAAGQITGSTREAPADGMETRHVNTQSLLTGQEEAQAGQTYRLVTVEEDQISIPRWIDYLKIVLLMLLAVAVIILPFVPFVLLNSRRKKALDARNAFDSESVSEAVVAMFRHVVAWLEATGHGAGNRLFRDWADPLAAQFSPEYAARYARCAALYEEAAYSGHPMAGEARETVRSLLEETESMLYDQAAWKLRFRLKYVECLRG